LLADAQAGSLAACDWLTERVEEFRVRVQKGQWDEGRPIDGPFFASITGALVAAVANLDDVNIEQRADRIRRGAL
jgi:hypothetical protein